MNSVDNFARKYIEFIHGLLKVWPIWVTLTVGAVILSYVTLPASMGWLAAGALAVKALLLKVRYVPLLLGVVYILCRKKVDANT